MSAAPVHKTPLWALPILALMFLGSLYTIYQGFPYSLIIAGALGIFIWVGTVLHARRMRSVAADRTEESICTFVRSFDYRQIDSWILRAVYEELSRYSVLDGRPLPIRADDRWEEDLKIDPEDLEDLVMDIAQRARRSMDDTKHNPLYGRVKTVRDIVSFFQHQARILTAEQIHPAK
jgi:hypothetical protein